jgi:AraC-like DNA-binding protein
MTKPMPAVGLIPDGERFERVQAKILRFFPELVAELGGNAATLLADAGFDGVEPISGNRVIGYRQVVQLFERAAVELDCPDFGMRLASRQGGGVLFGPLGTVMRHARTFGDALNYVSAHGYAHSLATRIWLRRFPRERAVFIGHDILLDQLESQGQAIEQILLCGHLVAKEITGGLVRARRVHFRHQPTMSPTTYRKYFGCAVFFGQTEDGLCFSERDLARPTIHRDAEAFRDAAAYIEAEFTQHHPPLHAQARGIVMQLLASPHCTNERVAGELAMHPRTLHRQLQKQGTSFHRIKDEVRRDLARYYLRKTTLEFSTISEILGFSEQAVMTRRCNVWFAASPTQIRQGGRPQPLGTARHLAAMHPA